MFSGASQINVDAKGRFAIPTRHREEVARTCEGSLVITSAPTADHLWMFPKPTWEDLVRKIITLPSEDYASERLRQILIGFAEDVSMDASGRVLISKVLRDHVGITKETWMIGQGTKFQIWQQDAWDKRLNALCDPDSDMPTTSEHTRDLALF